MTIHDDPALGRILNRRTFAQGDIIFHEGDKGSQAYVVQRGRVRIIKNMSSGNKGTLGFVETGGIFGEMALMDNSPRMATAVADEPTVVISIPEETVKKKLSKSNPVTKMMLMVMIRMLRSMSHDVELKPIKVDNIPHLKNHLFNE
ncbi:Crp/Fnr family transcriptional regulator [Curvivirga sp.]|uniref:Crp/Fnr family transcriptional regulator n=1 Tax=Curvivirga sp. TaxID=2856848 RepID=UPI003B5A2D93